ncbi:MAG: hypothetical protein IJV28_02845 [Paludibacteraceae bacterium]|nr:hypothetical protein [Paludibacteraceae bacterium]
MRNILLGAWMVLAALVFSSCGGQSEIDDPQEEAEVRFEIRVDSVETTAARIVIMPSDTVSTYYWNVFYAASIAGMSDETLRSEMEKDMEDEIRRYCLSGSVVTCSDILSRGEEVYNYKGMAANTDYAVLAVKMNGEGLSSGPVAKQYFKTLPVEEDSSVVIATGTAKLHDLRKTDGTFMLAANDGDLEITISVFSTELEGLFTSADMDQSASYITDWGMFKSFNILELEFTGKQEEGNYIYEGWFITVNKVKYRFRFLCSL